jgi:uncharacterized membrane protein YfcA
VPFGLGPFETCWIAVVLLGAAFVRGYSGFGFAALVVTGASLVTDPMNLVPVVVLGDIALTAQQARGIRGDVQWWRVRWLFLGCLIGVPLSVWALAAVGPDLSRIIIATYVLAMCAALLAGWHLRRSPGPARRIWAPG